MVNKEHADFCGVYRSVKGSCWFDKSAGRFLALRCKELLAQFPTSFANDLELRERGDIGADMQMSLQYRLRKKATLLAAIDVYKRQD